MADIQPIKPIKLCVNITIPTIDDDSISLYECVGILGNKLQEAIQKINDSFGSLEGAYTAANPPPYPGTSVNGKTGAVVIDIPANVYTENNPPPYPVTSVNLAETKDVITVYVPEGGGIEDATQKDLIAACKAGARLGAFDQDDGTCRLYHFNLYIDPERVDYKEVVGGGASGVTSVNDRTGAVNIFNAPINAATAESVTTLAASTNEKIAQLNTEKAAYSDVLTLEEIQASTNLVNKIASAESAKELLNRFGYIQHIVGVSVNTNASDVYTMPTKRRIYLFIAGHISFPNNNGIYMIIYYGDGNGCKTIPLCGSWTAQINGDDNGNITITCDKQSGVRGDIYEFAQTV